MGIDLTGISSLLKDYIAPLGLITFFGSFLAYFLKKRDENRTKQLNLIDTLIIGINRIEGILDNLKVDAGDKNYFSYKNILPAKQIIERLQSVINDIFLFSEDTLKDSILKSVDYLSNVIEDVKSVEDLAIRESDKTNDSNINNLRANAYLRLELFKLNIEIDRDGKPQFIKGIVPNKAKLTSAESIINAYNLENISINQSKQNTDKFIKDRRDYLMTTIQDAQAKLKELKQELTNYKLKHSGFKLFFFRI